MSFIKIPAEVVRTISDSALQSDEEMVFPQIAFQTLTDHGLLSAFAPNAEFDFKANGIREQLHLLRQIGAADLSVARIYEGHLNALFLISRFGDQDQKVRWFEEAGRGKIFGVWNTEANNGVQFAETSGNLTMTGAKTFCSGSFNIDYPIVTGRFDQHGWQMAVIDLKKSGLTADSSFWNPLGMRASVSHRIDFTGLMIARENLLGAPGDYYTQPGFGGGAIRFSAVQVGGAQAILDGTIDYLRLLGRTDDQFQKQRVAEMAVQLGNGMNWIESAGARFEKWGGAEDRIDDLLNTANMMRHAVEEICNRIMLLSEKSVGARDYAAWQT